jgi:hypothetical protein
LVRRNAGTARQRALAIATGALLAAAGIALEAWQSGAFT